MTEDRPPAPDRKTSLVAPLILGGAVLLLLAVLLLSRPRPEAAPPPVSPPPAATPPSPEPARGPLDRRAMIEAATAEAAAYAAGANSPKAGTALKGRTFAIRIPFGCAGAQAAPAAGQVVVERNEDGKTYRLVARPTAWTALPLMQDAASSTPEAVEGFWLPRPWAYAETCPPQRAREAPATPTPAAVQTLGLAQLFEPGGSRVLRRDGRPYEIVRKAPPEGVPATSYRLLLEGRIAAFADGRPIRCESESPDHRPICFYAVTFERVAFETAKGDLLAEWRE